MALEKESLINFLPDGFETLNQEGYKENFSADKIATGYEKDIKDRVTGPNLNNLIDVIGKNTNTLNNYVEYLNNMPISSVPYVNANNQLDYQDIGQLRNKADKNLANTGMITNCLLEVPQRIKYTLVDGTLTIKAGSVVIVPYGTEDKTSELPVGSTFINENFKVYDTQYADGKFFVWAELVEDTSASRDTTDTKTRAINITINLNELGAALNTSSGTSVNNSLYYNTTTNYIDFVDSSGVFSNNVYCLPLGLIVANGTIAYSSIYQVFNGMGYIGSTVWVDKGVKGLIPNKRNEDGSLRNIEWTNDKIRTTGADATGNFYVVYQLDIDNFGIKAPASWVFDEDENIFVYKDGIEHTLLIFSNVNLDAGVVSSFNPKQPFRAVDYNDYASTPHIVQNYVSGTSWYRVWSDGWIEQGGYKNGKGDVSIALLKNFTNTNYQVQMTPAHSTYLESAPVVKTSNKATSSFVIKNLF